jgi:hypothetical protein
MQLHGGVGPTRFGPPHVFWATRRSWKILRRALADAHNWPLANPVPRIESISKSLTTSPLQPLNPTNLTFFCHFDSNIIVTQHPKTFNRRPIISNEAQNRSVPLSALPIPRRSNLPSVATYTDFNCRNLTCANSINLRTLWSLNLSQALLRFKSHL